MVTINIKGKDLYLISAVFILLIGSGIVVAYNPNYQTTPGNPAIMGHTIDEINTVDDDGNVVSLEQYITNLVNSVNGALVCETTPIYDYSANGNGVGRVMPAYNYNEGIVSIPATCKSDAGCVIKVEIYNSGSSTRPIVVRRYDYIQYATNKWWSSHRTAGDAVNGDSVSTDIMPRYGSDTKGYLYLRDDYVYRTTTVETDSSKWTFIDRTGTWGMKAYICSYGDSEPA